MVYKIEWPAKCGTLLGFSRSAALAGAAFRLFPELVRSAIFVANSLNLREIATSDRGEL
ncbi:MAG: hypothetical protein U1F34_06880 [Gammaproteobacteria bacterium]